MAKNKKKHKHRNAAPAASVRRPRAANNADDEAIDFGTIAAALGGGLGGAFAGGWLASRGWTEEAVSAVMAVGGGVAAVLTEGPIRVASMGVAAAGAGQFASTLFGDENRDRKVQAAARKLVAKHLAEMEAAAIAADKSNAPKGAPASKPANAALPYGPEEAFQRARARLAALHDEEATEGYAAAA